MTMRPPRRVTRTSSRATSKGRGANMAPKIDAERSNEASGSSSSAQASPSWKRRFARPASRARAWPARTRLEAMSTPRTSAPSCAAGSAVVPSPQPRSRTRSPGATPIARTSASPLSRIVRAMRVKSPFSQRALLGLAGCGGEAGGAEALRSGTSMVVVIAVPSSLVVCAARGSGDVDRQVKRPRYPPDFSRRLLGCRIVSADRVGDPKCGRCRRGLDRPAELLGTNVQVRAWKPGMQPA